MAEVLVKAETGDGAVLLREHVSDSSLESPHYAAQLIERIGWAVVDASDAERDRGAEGVERAGAAHAA